MTVAGQNNKSLVSPAPRKCVKPQTKCVNNQQSRQNLFPARCDPGPVQILDTGAWHRPVDYLIEEQGQGEHSHLYTLFGSSPCRMKSKFSPFHRRTRDELWGVNNNTGGWLRCFYAPLNSYLQTFYLCLYTVLAIYSIRIVYMFAQWHELLITPAAEAAETVMGSVPFVWSFESRF